MIIIEPTVKAQASIIWLHGLGADANDFVGIIDQLGLPKNHSVRFVFPNAAFQNITVNQGMRMRAWYDIYALNILSREDSVGIEKSQQVIAEIIATQEAQGISSNNIVLAGFSQGGAMSLYAGLRYVHALAGIICLSAYMPLVDKFDPALYPQNKSTPIFMAHGMFDTVVPYGAGQDTYMRLQQGGYNVEWNAYPMAHTVNLDEIYAIGAFINKVLKHA